ncbi:MAG: TatD family hydrolase [Magnetococcales bacterium]|nr:TatD family hydrolase [Magnetococcales bacterium]
MPFITDTHAHLCDPVFDPDREAVLKRGREAGVERIIVVGETLADGRRNLELAAHHPTLRPAAGLYPTHLDSAEMAEMVRFIREHHASLIAIGEVGLDYWVIKEEGERALQRQHFQAFIALSKELNLPLNVHSRSAGHHAIALMLQEGAQKVQLHAFDGKASRALPGVEAGWFFSIPPSIRHSQQKRKLVARLPLSHLLIETDSPVLGPVQGERNEPMHVRVVIEEIAAIKEISPEAVKEATWENAARLYGEKLA